MPAEYKIDTARRLVLTVGSGVVTMADLQGHQERLRQDPEFEPRFSQLLDFTGVTKLEFGANDVRQLALKPIFSSTSRRAVLTTNDEAFRFARLFETLRHVWGERGIRVFRDRGEALDWIRTTDERPGRTRQSPN
ncbi:MAG: hypothetical protein ACHQ2Z_16775 [Elusimicrobiota bacterium]